MRIEEGLQEIWKRVVEYNNENILANVLIRVSFNDIKHVLLYYWITSEYVLCPVSRTVDIILNWIMNNHICLIIPRTGHASALL